ncbi:MAG TPA: 2-dehydropantoate 2-reductase [Bacillales bacterium]|nr:2-dehydropantoate 2-reductase [Bacillales bacterium]
MDTAIIGGGAIGLLFAYYFAEAGHRVTVYVRRKEQAQELRRDGVTLIREGSRRHIRVKADVFPESGEITAGLVIIAVKQYHLAELAHTLPGVLAGNAKLLFVQNGMGHVSFMETLPHSDIYVGIVEHGALKERDSNIRHTGAGSVKLAAFRGNLEECIAFWDGLDDFHFPAAFRGDWYTLMAEKLLANAVINPLTALCRVQNGALIDNPYLFENMARLFEETFGVLALHDKEKYWDYVLHVCRSTSGNRSSMLRDIELERPTEIEAISGFLLQEGEKRKKELPLTSFMYRSIKGISSRGRGG